MAAAFGGLLRREMRVPLFVAPVNEISFVSWAGGDTAYLNPFDTNGGPELKKQLVRGAAPRLLVWIDVVLLDSQHQPANGIGSGPPAMGRLAPAVTE